VATIDASFLALAVHGSHPTRGRKYKGWKTSMLYFSLTYHVTYLMKVTGAQCSPMYIQCESAVVYLAKEVPWDYGNLYLQKTTSLKKHLPSIIA